MDLRKHLHPARHPSRREHAFSLIWVLVIVAGLTAAALVLSPTVANTSARELSVSEDETLLKLADGLKRSVVRTHVIPGSATWLQAAADAVGSDVVSVRQVFPQFSTDVRSRRVYLIDPRFSPNLLAQILPLAQPAAGLDPAIPAEVPNVQARALLVSSTKKSARLPLTSGLTTAAIFDALWDWNRVPGGPTPFASLGLAWAGNASELHVAPVDYRSLFHLISFRKLTYSADGGAYTMVTNTASRYFLKGTRLQLFALTNGMHVVSSIVDRDASFDLGSVFEPIVWYPFVEGHGTMAVTNYGKLGSSLNASLANGCTEAISTLTAPLFPGYAVGNLSLSLDGADDYLDVAQPALNGLTQFSLSCWIKPADLTSGGIQGICGQNGLIALGLSGAAHELQVTTVSAGSFSVPYPHPINTWHHLALTGDGAHLRLYLDGTLVFTGGAPPSGGTYGANASPFRVGGGSIFDASGNFFQGELDDLGVFTKALDASQVANLMLAQLPP